MRRRKTVRCGRWALSLAAVLVLGSAGGAAAARGRPAVSAWDAAVHARAALESEPKGQRTRVEYAKVMDRFRAVYHDGPTDAHAARAVEQVAELLAEEGREFGDRKALHDAAGQYEFLAKAYPSYKARKRKEGEGKSEGVSVRSAEPRNPEVAAPRSPLRSRETSSFSREDRSVGAAVLTGIRHWSTGTYTRVAIDLGPDAGEDVSYQAVRVKDPDRIFFDLHHVTPAPELEGKTFTVTDGGFLSSIRAAQLKSGPQAGDSTRVVLDVHEVGGYSAFLLPNPERLIIDIHGKQEAGSRKPEVGQSDSMASSLPAESVPVPIVRSNAANGVVEVSRLPPMPVTDGSAGFGLPLRSAAQPKAVPQPRVVIPTRPTASRPVPNTVTKSSAQNGTDVAAVSDQPGKIVATRRPTSLPVSSGSTRKEVVVRKQEAGSGAAGGAIAPSSQFPASSSPVTAQPETSEGDTTLVRALGLKIGRIVIDAGHGGHDSGTLGAGGIEEKDVVLDVALRLGRLLHDRLGAEIVYTRADDTFVPLETRTAIANKAQADLFISVHANSSPDAGARGVEVYYLNFTSDPDAMKVASRENAVSTQSVHDLSDLVKKIALKDKIDESRELATDVDASLYAGLAKGNVGLKDRGVKKAPFVVLIGANMPSVLAEISFVTNPTDAEQLNTPAYRERVAESLYKGVAKYAAGINGQGAPVKKTKGPVTERAAR